MRVRRSERLEMFAAFSKRFSNSKPFAELGHVASGTAAQNQHDKEEG